MGLLKKKHHQPIKALQSKNRNGLPTALTAPDQAQVDAKNFATQAALLTFQKPVHSNEVASPPSTTFVPTLSIQRRASTTSAPQALSATSSVANTGPSVKSKPNVTMKRTPGYLNRNTSTHSNLSSLMKKNTSSGNLSTSNDTSTKPANSAEFKQPTLSAPVPKRYSVMEPLQQQRFPTDDTELSTNIASSQYLSIGTPDKKPSSSFAASAASLAIKSAKLNDSQDLLSVSPFTKPSVPGPNGNHSNDEYYGHSNSTFSSMHSYLSSTHGRSAESLATHPPNTIPIQPQSQNWNPSHSVPKHTLSPSTRDANYYYQGDTCDHFGTSFDGFDSPYYVQRPHPTFSSRSNSNTTNSIPNSRSNSNIVDEMDELGMTLDSKLGWNDSTEVVDNRTLAPPKAQKTTLSSTARNSQVPSIQHEPPTPTEIVRLSSPVEKVISPKALPTLRTKPPLENSKPLSERPKSPLEKPQPSLHYPVPTIPSASEIYNKEKDTSFKQLPEENISHNLRPPIQIEPGVQRQPSGKIPTRKAPSSISVALYQSPPRNSSVPEGLSILSGLTGNVSNPDYDVVGSSRRGGSPKRKPPPTSPPSGITSTTEAPSLSYAAPTSELQDAFPGSAAHYDADESLIVSDDEGLPQFPLFMKQKSRRNGSNGHRVHHSSFSTSSKIKAIADPHYKSTLGFKRNAKNIFRKGLKSAGYNSPSPSPQYDHRPSRHHDSHAGLPTDSAIHSDSGNFTEPEELIRSVQLKTTMRKEKKSDKINEEKPWKQHNDRHYITDQEKKRYQGLWASNKGLYFQYLDEETIQNLLVNDLNDDIKNPALTASKISAAANATPHPESATSEHVKLEEEFKNIDLILNIVVRDLWIRSRLSHELLEQIYELVDVRKDGFLDKKSFIVGMWLVDQCLYGRRLPKAVSEELWNSAFMNVNVLLRKKGLKKR